MSWRTAAVGGLLATAALALAACGGHDAGPDPLGAAEPAAAPPVREAPAGRTFRIGALPQGIVYDERTDLLAVAVHAPYRLLLLDGTTLRSKGSVRLPGKVRHLQLAKPGGPVLVPAETADRLLRVALPGGDVTATGVEEHPHDATATGNGDVVVGNEFSGSLSVIDDGKVTETVDDLEQPGSVVSAGNTVVVVDVGTFTLSTYDAATMERTGRTSAGAGPTHAVSAGHGRIAVADTRGDQILVFGLDPLRRLGRIDLPGSPYGLVADPESGTVWVTLTGKNELVGLRVAHGTPKVVARYPTVRQPDTVAVAPGGSTLWVTGTANGTVQRITRPPRSRAARPSAAVPPTARSSTPTRSE